MIEQIKHSLVQGRSALDFLLKNDASLEALSQGAKALAECFEQGGRAFSCGNGGSMCDAMHFAEELTGRYGQERRALPAVAISDASHMSCTGNDYGYDYIFSRYLEAHGRKGDFLLAISTSGTSKNVLKAAEHAKKIGMNVLSLTGRENTALKALATWDVACPSESKYADRSQELHIKCIHILIELCELQLFSK